jgi:hypothetical protein
VKLCRAAAEQECLAGQQQSLAAQQQCLARLQHSRSAWQGCSTAAVPTRTAAQQQSDVGQQHSRSAWQGCSTAAVPTRTAAPHEYHAGQQHSSSAPQDSRIALQDSSTAAVSCRTAGQQQCPAGQHTPHLCSFRQQHGSSAGHDSCTTVLRVLQGVSSSCDAIVGVGACQSECVCTAMWSTSWVAVIGGQIEPGYESVLTGHVRTQRGGKRTATFANASPWQVLSARH